MYPPEPLWRRRKKSRTELRKGIAGKRRTPHGGRGKKYGLKGGRTKRRSK